MGKSISAGTDFAVMRWGIRSQPAGIRGLQQVDKVDGWNMECPVLLHFHVTKAHCCQRGILAERKTKTKTFCQQSFVSLG